MTTSTYTRNKIKEAKEKLEQITTHGRGSFLNIDDMVAEYRKLAREAKTILEEAEQDY